MCRATPFIFGICVSFFYFAWLHLVTSRNMQGQGVSEYALMCFRKKKERRLDPHSELAAALGDTFCMNIHNISRPRFFSQNWTKCCAYHENSHSNFTQQTVSRCLETCLKQESPKTASGKTARKQAFRFPFPTAWNESTKNKQKRKWGYKKPKRKEMKE